MQQDEKRFIFGDEQVIDLWFDPTGNLLKQGEIYVSGFSIAYGFTEKFQISTRYWDFKNGWINIRPKYKILDQGNLDKKISISIGSKCIALNNQINTSRKIKELIIK